MTFCFILTYLRIINNGYDIKIIQNVIHCKITLIFYFHISNPKFIKDVTADTTIKIEIKNNSSINIIFNYVPKGIYLCNFFLNILHEQQRSFLRKFILINLTNRNPIIIIFYVLLLRNSDDIPKDPNHAKPFLKLSIFYSPNVYEKSNFSCKWGILVPIHSMILFKLKNW